MRRRRQMVRWVGGVGLAGLLATGCGTNAPDSASGPDEPLALTPNSALQELVPTEPELLEAIQTSPTPRTITFSVPLDPRQPAAGPRDQQQERAYRLKRPYRTTEVLVGRPSDALPFERVAVPIGTDVANALASLGAEPNYLTFLAGEPTNDPYFSWQWALAKIAAPEAWELFPASAPVRVAVLDTGVDAAHPDLFGRVLPGYNAINNTENADDDHGHGTMVAGVIGAGGNNGLGIAGVAPQVEILPIKVIAQSGEGSYADLIAGIYYAIEHGADVINISAGAYAPSNLLHDALTAAEVAGIVVVAAAGNDATDTPMYPAAYPEAMAVTATDATDAIWPESNYGTHVDLAAPGANIMSTMSGGGYAFADGTSLATAHVAGAAALLLSHAAAQTGADVVSRLLSSAIDLGAKGKDAAYGEGRLTLIPPTVGKPVADAGELPAGDAEEIGQGPITVQYNVEIHQDIASAALLFLKKKLEEKAITQEMYDEFAEYKFWIRDGARAEDKAVLIGKFAEKVIDFLFGEGAPWHDPKNGKGLDPLAWGDIAYEDVNCRWFRHFYRPIDKQGFLSPPAFVEWCGELDKSMVGKEHIEFPNAYEWGGKANAQNSFDWEDAKVHYHSPDTTQKYPGLIEQNGGFFFKLQPLKLQRAYYALGHVLHLLMDTSVPEHTHIEAHAEVNPGGYEHYMKKQGTGGVMSRLNTGLLLKPLNEYPTLEKYFHEMATYSFNRNLFQGNLTGDEASGELSQMFPSLHKTLAGWWVIAGWDDTTNFFCNPSSLCDLWWSGQGDGDGDDVDFDDDWWEETEFKDSPAPPGFYYIEKSNEVCPKMYHNTPKPGNNGDMVSGKCKDKTLAAMMADDIIPMVIQYTASAMRLFWHETHADLKIVPFSVNVLQTAVPAKGSNVANYQLKFTIRNDGGADSGNVFAGFRPPGSLLEFGTTMLPSIPPGGEAPVKIALNGIALPLCAPCAAGTIVAHYVHGSETQAVATHAIYGGDIKLPKTPGGVDFSKVDLTGLSVDPATGAIDFVLKGTPAGEGEASVDASALQEKLKATFLTALTIPNWKQFISLDLLPDGNGGFVGKARTEPPFEQTALANTMWTADVAMKLELFSAQHQKPNLDKWVSLVQGSPYWPQISAAGFNASPTYVARGTIVPGLSSPLQATIDQAFLDQAPLAVDIGWSQQPSINLSPYNFSQPVVENFQSLVTEWKGFFEAGMKDLAAVVLQKMSAGDPAYGDLAALYPAVLLAQWYKTLPKGSLPYADIINKEALADLDLVVPFNQSYWDGQAAQPLGSTNVSWFNGETWIFNYWGGAEFFVGFNGKTESLGQAEETLLTTVTGGEAVQQGDTWYFSGGSASQDQPDLAGMMSVTTALVVATKNAIIALTITNASNIAAGPVAYKILDQVTNGGAPITLAVAEGNLPGVGGWDGVSVEIPWSVPDLVGLHQLSLAIDPANAIAENNESNNMFQTMVAVISPLPKVAILAPSGGTLPKGEAILFSGSAIDVQGNPIPGEGLVWSSNISGVLGTGSSIVHDLPPGQHLITLKATDTEGATAAATRTVTIATPGVPAVAILAPVGGAVLSTAVPIAFLGEASDSADGPLTGSSLAWVSSKDGALGTGTSLTTTLSEASHTITLTAVNSLGAKQSATVTVNVQIGTPSLAIVEPEDGATGSDAQPMALKATATDGQDGDLTAKIEWYSDIAGWLGKGGAVAATLSPGAQTITAKVTDSNGLSASATRTVTITATPPAVTITAPANGTTADFQSSVTFTGSAADPTDGQLSAEKLAWSSNLNGFLGFGATLTTAALNPGIHVITLTGTDSDGAAASAAISLIVDNGQPIVTITTPAPNATFVAGQPVQLAGSATDTQDGALTEAALQWSSSLNGALGTGEAVTVQNLSPGAHTITLTATDTDGWETSAAVPITIILPKAPAVAIISPSPGKEFLHGDPITFQGSANDPEDGALGTGQVEWRSSLDGLLGDTLQFTAEFFSIGTHVVTFKAKDSQGMEGTATVTLVVMPKPPSVTILTPKPGQNIVSQAVCTPLNGEATDELDLILPDEAFEWRSNLVPEPLGLGKSICKDLSAGTHEITLTVTDSNGAQGLASAKLIVVAPDNKLLTTFADGKTSAIFSLEPQTPVIAYVTLPKEAQVTLAQVEIAGSISIQWQFMGEEAVGGDVIDVGYHSMPTFADIDGDGDQDLFIGFNAGGGGAGGIYFYRNDGTPAQHQWTFVTDNFGGFAKDNSMTNFAPDFMDVDKDGDPDVVIGWQDVISPETYAGHIDFYRNIGTAAESQWALENVFADGITGLMNYPRPALSDIDADGDVDLFSGAYNPEMSFYKNDGGVWTFITQYYPGVSCQYAGAFSPTFVDIDQDGDDDLFDGSDKLEENGFNQLIYYRNVGSPQQDVLTCIPFTLPGWNENVFLPAPTFTDIDADGDQDLFVGNYEGGVRFWQNPGPQYPFDPSFDVGGDNQYEWSHSGNYSGKETTADFSTVLNTYMASAPADPNGLVQVPFVVTSNSAGILELTNLNIQYQVTDTEPPTILGVGVNDPQCFVPPGGDCGVGHDKAGVVIAAKVSDNDDIAGVTATIGDGPPMTFTETGPDWYESPGFKAPGLPGPYLIAVTVTDTNGLSASGNLLLHVQTTGPELAIDQDLELSPAVPLDLQPAAITAMVHNYGGQKASFWIEFRLNGEFYDEKAMSLEEGETGKKVTFSGWVASVGVNTATIELDPEKLVPEQKVNNKATITFTVADGTPPVIGGVVFGPAWEGPIPITVEASDNDDIASVVASVAGKTVPCTYQPAQQNYQGVLEMNVGNYLVDVVATDSSGLSSHQQVPLVVKPQKADLAVGPADLTVTPANPQAGEAAIICMTLRNVGTQHVPFATGTLLIDSATVYSFTLSLDGGAALPPQCYSWKGSYEPHTLKFIADPNQEVEELDEGNNQTERSVSVVNQVPPQITALTIASPVTQGVPATVEAGVTSTVPLASVTATTPSGTVPLICVDGLCKGQVVYPQPGASFVTVTATDESGLKQSKEQPVTVLANLPDLSVQQVKVMEVQVIDGSPAAIVTTVRNLGTASAEPINVTFRVDGKTKGETTLPGLNGEAVVQFQWSAQYGPHTAEIAVDPANALIEADEGNNSYQWSIHVIDQTPPVIEIVEAPKSIPVGTPLPVSVAAWDNVALASVTAQLGEASGQLGYNASSKRYEGSVPTPVTGLLPLTISAKDTSGLAATYSVGVTVAEDTPDVAVAAMAVIPAVVPEDAPLPIAFSVQNFGGIAVTTKIHLVVDGAVAQAQPVSLGANAAVPQEMTITPAYGEHVAKIIADPDGTLAEPNEANNQLMFTFFAADLTPPTPPALAVAPVGWSEVTTFTVTWGAATDKHGIAEYQYRLDQNPWQSVGNTTTWTAGPVSEGEHTIAVRAIDSHGNVSEPGYAAIKSDVSPPPAPLLEETHCGTIWTTHDSPQLTWATPPDPGSGVARYRLAIDGVETILGNVNMYHPTLESGIHTFRLRAVDLLEHAGPWSNTITVRIDTAPPRAPAILSPTHPDAEPSPNNRPLFLLTAHPDTSGVVGYSYLFDQLPTTTPGPYDLWRSADVSGTTEIAITAMPTMTGEMLPVADGAWYLHAVAKDAVGLVSPMAAHYEIQIDTVPALTRFDIDGDGQGDAVIHQDGKGLYRQRLADPADPAPLLLKGLVPAFVNGDVIDMARRVTGWPATLWLWDNAIQTLTSYQPTLNTVGAGKLLADEGTLPFRIDTTVGDRLLVGDINGDGRDDLVVYRAMPRAFYRSLITDAGSLSDWALFASTATMGGVGPEDVVELADLDGDMLADLVWIAPKKTTFWVFTNDPPQWIALSGCGIDPAHGDAARVGDVTGDAKTDLVWMATSNMTTTLPILVQENTSSDALSLAPPLTWGTFTTPPDMAAGDQLLLFPSDGDAMADLLLYRQNYAVIERYTSTGDQFAPKGRVSHSWPIVPDLLASDLLNATAYSPKGTTMTDTPTGMVLELWNNCWPAEGGVGP